MSQQDRKISPVSKQFVHNSASGGARILEQAGPAAGPKVLW